MAKGKTSKSKGIKSSGAKKRQNKLQQERIEVNKNHEKGMNPNTGKEYLVFARFGNVFNYVESYQTRVGALAHKPKGGIVLLSERFEEKQKEYRKNGITLKKD